MSVTEVLSSANDILAAHSALLNHVRQCQQNNRRQLQSLQSVPHELLQLPLIPSPQSTQDSPPLSPTSSKPEISQRNDIPPVKRARLARYKNYVPEEETIRNDYSQRYVDGGEWPQNWVLGAEPDHRFEEYPKQRRLLELKKASVNENALPPTYLSFSDLTSLQPNKFDVILLDPPFSSSFTWDHLQDLPIPSFAADPSFVFMWVGSGAGDGLERGREVLGKWGYRRCEDVVWVKTNHTSNLGPGTDPPTTSLLTRTKQHCLIGIRGTVRRSTDSWFVHCNVDTDVIIWEGDAADPIRKPPEMYTLIENFCLGLRRLEIFGRAPTSLRRGWVTVFGEDQEEKILQAKGNSLEFHVDGPEGGDAVRWQQEAWENGIKELSNGNKAVVPLTSEIDALRPKSPVRQGQQANNSLSGPQNPGIGVVSGGVPLSGGRFVGPNARPFGGVNQAPIPMQAQNQMMMQPMMGMAPGMGVAPFNMGMNADPAAMMASGMWNPMMGGMAGPMGMMGGVPMGFQPGNEGFMGAQGMFNAGMAAPGMGWADPSQLGMEMPWDGTGMMGANPTNMGMGGWGGNSGPYQ